MATGCAPQSWPTCSSSIPGACADGSFVNQWGGNTDGQDTSTTVPGAAGTGTHCMPDTSWYGYKTQVSIGAGLLERSSGEVKSGSYLVTSNGEYVFNLAYGCYNSAYRGWKVRVFDPAKSWQQRTRLQPTSLRGT